MRKVVDVRASFLRIRTKTKNNSPLSYIHISTGAVHALGDRSSRWGRIPKAGHHRRNPTTGVRQLILIPDAILITTTSHIVDGANEWWLYDNSPSFLTYSSSQRLENDSYSLLYIQLPIR